MGRTAFDACDVYFVAASPLHANNFLAGVLHPSEGESQLIASQGN
jgi:hypothetical protein